MEPVIMDIEPRRDAVAPLNSRAALAGAKRAAALLLALDETAAGKLTAGLDVSELAAIAAERRAALDHDLAAARTTLPPRPAPDREALILGLSAHQLAAAIKGRLSASRSPPQPRTHHRRPPRKEAWDRSAVSA